MQGQVQSYSDMSDLLEVLSSSYGQGPGQGQWPADAISRLLARRLDEAGVVEQLLSLRTVCSGEQELV